jgi:glycosyltransferase involved in cell wall biosynthesis
MKKEHTKPKLLIATDSFLPRVDGIAVFLHSLIPELAKTFDITVIAPDFAGSYKRDPSVKFIRIPIHSFQVSDYPPPKAEFGKVKKAVKNADVVYSQTIGPIGGLSIRYGKKFKKPVVSYIHSIEWELVAKSISDKRWVEKIAHIIVPKVARYLYNSSTHLLIPYPRLRDELEAKGIKTHSTVVKLGIDLKKFKPTQTKAVAKAAINITEDTFVLGYVGRISRQKNLGILLRAFKRLDNQKNVKLLMIGDGPDNQTEKFKKTPNCRITGFVSDVKKYLEAVDVYIMPSLTETTSLSTLEAMAMKIPVIVTKVGYMKEYIKQNKNGLFFPRKSSTMLATKIEGLRADPATRREMGGNARKTVVELFSWKKTIDSITKILLKEYSKTQKSSE